MNKKNGKGTLIGGIVAAVAAVLAFIGRIAVSIELEGIKNTPAAVVVAGSKQMSRPEYIKFATDLINKCTIAAVVLLVIAVILLAAYNAKKKR